MRASRVILVLIVCCIGGLHGAECPEDSVRQENGSCKCVAECPPPECQPGQHPVQARPADSQTPGSCCPRYNCVPSGSRGSETCPEDSALTEDRECKCMPCQRPSCRPDERPVQVKAAPDPETPGSCCPLYDCKPSDPVSWAKKPPDETEMPSHCTYERKTRKLGERWKESACVSCVCQEDGVSCQTPMCKFCENAIPPNSDECCPHCPSPTNVTFVDPEPACQTSLEDCTLRCDHGYENDESNCPICKCAERKDIAVDQAPPDEDKVCPELPHCLLNCDLMKDEGGCSVCACQPPPYFVDPSNDTVVIDEDGKKICPEVKCDLHCERGLVMDENDCTFCKCKAPNADCPPLIGCRKRCPFGYKTNKRGCPMCRCRASCMDRLNETHPEGSTWQPNSCTTCTCEPGGRLSCKETICSVACSNPLPPKPGTCCPICPIKSHKEDETSHQSTRGWGTVPITLIALLALICLLLIIHTVRSRFRGRLSPSDASYSSYPPQYYKCVPAYDTPVHRNEKIVPL